MNNKPIDIDQRIPIETLAAALESYLNDSYSNDYILEQLRLDFNGENRLKKALRVVNKIVPQSPLSELLLANKEEIKNIIKKKTDRDVILIALLNSAFSFSFAVLRTFGKFFAVQDIVNTQTIKNPISNIYSGNKSTEIAFYSVVPMFIEAGFFSRTKMGMYQCAEKLKITEPLAIQIYQESFKLNNAYKSLKEYQMRDPYFHFVL
ncbi:MAG: hypothetical protein PHI32_10435 [Dysgonamonadaceae bacterium]|nr:hypothetical protein [Dysgonamonadaceae bacterium]MDD4728447.1 hypothetical protein [Dysgonamonadaceae bacterium]